MINTVIGKIKSIISIIIFVFLIANTQFFAQSNLTYPIVDTGQKTFYNNYSEISKPSKNESFYGQDAQFDGNQPSYSDNGDGTITDNVTGLMWSKSPDLNGNGIINIDDKLTYDEALEGASSFKLAGYTDWRLPSIKELYSLIDFNGVDPSGYNGTNVSGLVPFINTDYFDFGYGDTEAGERIIDAQFATTSIYKGTTMGGNATMFGVNFADGRIKGYPYEDTPAPGGAKTFYVYYVRGNSKYGINNYKDNKDGTITDKAAGLMWTQDDNGKGVIWEDALAWVQQKNEENYLGYNNWRLPNVKELQSIVDYSRSLQETNTPAIDSLFQCSAITDEGGGINYPFYWSSTTHTNMMNGDNAAYVAFGEALGWMQDPFTGDYRLMDVHGAGVQRSDPKTGDPADYPYGHGPQGDVIRIYNYVRLVRDAGVETSVGENNNTNIPGGYVLYQNYPNPFNPTTTIKYSIPTAGIGRVMSLKNVVLKIYDTLGKEITTLVNNDKAPGNYEVTFNAGKLSSGIYFYKLSVDEFVQTKKMIFLK